MARAAPLLPRRRAPTPVVKARLSRAGEGLQVLVYVPDQKELFARICGFFGRIGPTILEAKVHTTRNGYALDTFAVQDPGEPGGVTRRRSRWIEHELTERAGRAGAARAAAGRAACRGSCGTSRSRRKSTSVPDDKGTHYILEVVAGDRPGLLARIAYVLANANVNVASAKINTLGERAEDVFLVDGARLHDEQALLSSRRRFTSSCAFERRLWIVDCG